MADASQYTLPYKEVAEVLIKHLDLHEGYWSVFLRFGIQAANMSINNSPHQPTAIIPVQEIGISREPEMGPLAVDASKVNPVYKHAGKKAGKKGKK